MHKLRDFKFLGTLVLITLTSWTCIGAKSEILDSALGEAEQDSKDKDCKQTKMISLRQLNFYGNKKYSGPSRAIICDDGAVDSIAPVLSLFPGGGSYGRAQYVTIKSSEAAEIFYTLDGTDPNPNSDRFDASNPIMIDSSKILRYMGSDIAGNTSEIRSATYTIDASLPNVVLAMVDSPSVSGDTSLDLSINAYWQSNVDGTFRLEIGGVGIKGTGFLYQAGDVAGEPTSMVTSIHGPSLNQGINTFYLYVTNDLGVTGFTTFDIFREEEAPAPSVDVVSGYYGAAQDVVISVPNEDYGVQAIYYTVDGTDPTGVGVTTEPDGADSDYHSDVCQVYPYHPTAGQRCYFQASYTNPIHLEPTGGLDREIVTLKFFAVDAAGNISTVSSIDYDIDLRTPEVTADPSLNVVNGSGTLDLHFTPAVTGHCQVAVDVPVGMENIWDEGILNNTTPPPTYFDIPSGLTDCEAGADFTITLLGQHLNGPSGTKSRVVFRNAVDSTDGSPVGNVVVEVVRDDTPPDGTINPGGNTVGWSRFDSGGQFENGIVVAAEDNTSAAANVTVHYRWSDLGVWSSTTGNGNIPVLHDKTGAPWFDVDEAASPISKTETLEYYFADEAGNQTPVFTREFKIAATGDSLQVTAPQNISVPQSGQTQVLVRNPTADTAEYQIELDWRSSCEATPNQDSSVFLEQGTIPAFGVKWVTIFEDLFPKAPYATLTDIESFTTVAPTTVVSDTVDTGIDTESFYMTTLGSLEVGNLIKFNPTDDTEVFREITSIVDEAAAGGAAQFLITFSPATATIMAALTPFDYHLKGSQDMLALADGTVAGSSIVIGSYFTYNQESLVRRVYAIEDNGANPDLIFFSPPLAEGNFTVAGADVDFREPASRKFCMYMRKDGDTGAYNDSMVEVYTDFNPPDVSLVDNPNGRVASNQLAVSNQWLASDGYTNTTITFNVEGGGVSGDLTVPAVYTVRKMVELSPGVEVPQDTLATGIVTTQSSTVFANIPVQAIPNESTIKVRVFAADPNGNVARSGSVELSRHDQYRIEAMTGSMGAYDYAIKLRNIDCGTSTSECNFALRIKDSNYQGLIDLCQDGDCSRFNSGGNEFFNPGYETGVGGIFSVPLQEVTAVADNSNAGDFQGGIGFASDPLSVTTTGEKIYFLSKTVTDYWPAGWFSHGDCYSGHNHPPTTTSWGTDTCQEILQSGNQARSRHYPGSFFFMASAHSGFTATVTTGTYINWGNTVITTHDWSGVKGLTMINQFGIQQSLTLDCSYNDSCILSAF